MFRVVSSGREDIDLCEEKGDYIDETLLKGRIFRSWCKMTLFVRRENECGEEEDEN